MLAIGSYLVLTEWMVRAQSYGALARRNLLQGVGQVVTQVGLGLAGVRPVGLLLGLAVGRLCGIGGALSEGGLLRRTRPRLPDLVAAVRRYRRFPLVASWSKLLNTAGLQLPLLLISVVYGDAAAGLLGLTVRVIGGPVGVIGQAVYQVFTAEASAKVRGDDRELAAFTRQLGAADAGHRGRPGRAHHRARSVRVQRGLRAGVGAVRPRSRSCWPSPTWPSSRSRRSRRPSSSSSARAYSCSGTSPGCC